MVSKECTFYLLLFLQIGPLLKTGSLFSFFLLQLVLLRKLAELCHLLLEFFVFHLYFLFLFLESHFLLPEVFFLSLKGLVDLVHLAALFEELGCRGDGLILVEDWYFGVFLHNKDYY